jgi:hypothetical protein
MKTVLENLKDEAKRLHGLLEELLSRSSIRRWHDPDGDGFVYFGGHFAWNGLDQMGLQIQAKTLEEYRRFFSLLRTLLREQTQEGMGKLEEANATILEVIEQQGSLYKQDANTYFQRAFQALESQVGLLDRLFGSSNANPSLVPDTNALIFNPDIEKWKFSGIPQYTLIFTPTVLAELDSLKVNHRVDAMREKSNRVINRLKEYRRRAAAAGRRLSDGVVLVSGVSEILSVAVEPKMDASLPWLDPVNKDDQLLAAVIEVMRQRPRSPVLLVTRDINLQNKAEFASIPYAEPPDPV